MLPTTLCSLFSILGTVLAEDKLLLAQAVFRHGARAPVTLFSSEESKTYFWRGLGQLTDEGVQQAHDLGKALRLRLVETGFLDKRHNPNEVSFYSSPRTRCIITASEVGAAMFDPIRENVVNVVAVQTDPVETNYLTYPQTSPALFAEIRQDLGAPENKTKTMDDIMGFYLSNMAKNSTYFKQKGRIQMIEALLVEKPLGIAVASWFDDDAEKEALGFRYEAMSVATGTGPHFREKWVKCRVGFLLHTLMKNIKESAACRSNCSSAVKFYAYSTHDLMVKPLLQALGIIDPALHGEIPPFTSTVLLELWKPEDPAKELYVKVLWKPLGASFIPLTSSVPGCSDDNCPVSNFTNCCTNFMTDSPATECSATGLKYLFSVIGVILFCIRRDLF